jgi:hypothetical protein
MTIRTDAPAACGCEVSWTSGTNGPKAAPCKCSGQAPARAAESVLDAAYATFDEEQRAAAKAGPPACATRVRDDGDERPEHMAGPPKGAATAAR